MIIIFDLDDTLYDERQFVEGGLQAVADMAARRWHLNAKEAYGAMIALFNTQGRSKIFDHWLAHHDLATKANIQKCVSCYRSHKPSIRMPKNHHQVLQQLDFPLYLVTDGNKIVQQNKIDALGIRHYFKRVFITHRHGIKYCKPSTYCFELIRKKENCDWQDMIYIGDNPAKDFVNLKKLGVRTIRIMAGAYKRAVARPGYDANVKISCLNQLEKLLRVPADE